MKPGRESGSAFLEMIVAAAIGLLVVLAALGAQAAARRSFQAAESAIERQQPGRQALDEITRTVRDAGAGLGTGATPDEAIEGAWPACLVVRGDSDAADPSGDATDPEWPMTLGAAPGAGPVTTGNDEITGWFLRNPSGSGGTTLRFEADVVSAVTVLSPGFGPVALRDGVVDPVDLARVVTAQTAPPYTLYRTTMSPAASNWASGSGAQVFAIADNVFSLAFRYFDASGALLAAPGGADAQRDARRAVDRVEVTIVVMSPDPDLAWTDPADPSPVTRHFRKYPLRATVFPQGRNRTGAPDPAEPPIPVPSGLAG
jgi:hypothetical protein